MNKLTVSISAARVFSAACYAIADKRFIVDEEYLEDVISMAYTVMNDDPHGIPKMDVPHELYKMIQPWINKD